MKITTKRVDEPSTYRVLVDGRETNIFISKSIDQPKWGMRQMWDVYVTKGTDGHEPILEAPGKYRAIARVEEIAKALLGEDQ